MQTPKEIDDVVTARSELGLGWVKIAPPRIVCMSIVGVEGDHQVSASGGVRLSYVAADAEPRPLLRKGFLISGSPWR